MLLEARAVLADALLQSKEECSEALALRLSPLGSAEYKERRRATLRVSIDVLARSLATGEPARPDESVFLSEFGSAAAQEHIPFAVLVQSYLVMRDGIFEHVLALGKRLQTPVAAVDVFRRILWTAVDTRLVAVAGNYDWQLQRISEARDSAERELEQRTEELARKNLELTRLDELKTQFVNNASHELRTPLAAIRAFSELLTEDSTLNDTQREFALAINLESERMTSLAADLLDLNRMKSGALRWNPRAVDLATDMTRLVHQQRLVADRQGVILELDIPDRLPRVTADPDGLWQVLLNLTANALKFSPEGARRALRQADWRACACVRYGHWRGH